MSIFISITFSSSKRNKRGNPRAKRSRRFLPKRASVSRPAAGRETDARFGRNRRERLARGLPRLFRLDEENVIDMKMLIGPLLERNGAYSYDTFTITDGLR